MTIRQNAAAILRYFNIPSEPAGYASALYAFSLEEFGEPRLLPRSGGWILERTVPGTPHKDGMGCYPLFACKDWSQLEADLQDLGQDLVALSLVTDPFGTFELPHLRRCFDVVIPFKEHFVADLGRPSQEFISRRHQRDARKAFRLGVEVEAVEDPLRFAEDWISHYDILKAKHNLGGIKAFSRAAFVRQLSVPGLVMFRASYRGNTVGLHLEFLDGEAAYHFLGAYSELGYKLRASCALYLYSIEYLAKECRWLDIGAGAGLQEDPEDSLSRFKMGWSTGTRTAYLCGRIFDPEKYAEIARMKGVGKTDYFPAYRAGEFG